MQVITDVEIENDCTFIFVKKYLRILKIFFPMGMTWKDFKDIFSAFADN